MADFVDLTFCVLSINFINFLKQFSLICYTNIVNRRVKIMNIFSKLVTTTLIAVSANFTGKAMPPQDHPPMVAATKSIREYAPLDDARSEQSGDQKFSELTSQNLIVFPQGIPQIPLKDFQINFRIKSVDDLLHPLTLCYPITDVRYPDVPRYTIRNIASSYCTAVSILEGSYVREKFSMEKNSDPSSKEKKFYLCT